MRNRASFIQFLAVAVLAAPAYAAPPASCGTLNAGLQILSNVRGAPGGSDYSGGLKMAVWYPTNAAASAHTYTGPGRDMTGQVALNAPAATCAQFPLIVFSHGWSGCGTQSIFLTEQLARLGYIVAAPDHNDHGCSVDGTSLGLLQVNFEFPFTRFGNPAAWREDTARYRHMDIENVLTYMLNTWAYKSSLKADQIVVAGHSFGGYAAFAKIGGWASWLNPGIKAALLYSPYIQPFSVPNAGTMSMPKVPQLFVTGGPQDRGIMPYVKGPQPCDSNLCEQPGAFEQSQALKYYGELRGSGTEANHFAFTNALCTNSGHTSVTACLERVENARTLVTYSHDFLEFVLNNRNSTRLRGTGPEWQTFWRTAGVPSGSYQAGAGGAPDQLVTLLGDEITEDNATAADGATVMPRSLARTTVAVVDSAGRSHPANLYFVSRTQVNLVLPAATAPGQAILTVSVAGRPVASGPITVKRVAPSLFAMPDNIVAGWAQSGARYIPIWSLAGAVPLNVAGGDTYLVILGTGLRAADNSKLSVRVGQLSFDGIGGPLPTMAASPQFQGLDQVSVGPLPSSLSGSGTVDVHVSVAGQTSNAVKLVIQ